MDLTTFAAGFGLGASLIIAIGAQNAYVLRQGILRQHVFLVCAICATVDWALIAVGAGGFGTLVARFPTLTTIAAWGGAGFLLVYGGMAFRSAIHPGSLDTAHASQTGRGALSVVATTLAVSLLNPHVYLDTVVVLGSIAAQYPTDERIVFALGAGVASFVWFFGLGYGARLLAPVFERPAAWRILDVFVGVVMWWIAAGLVWGQLG